MDSGLDQRLKGLMLLRVVIVTTLLLVAVYVEAVSETLLRINPLYFLIAFTYGLTLLYVLALRLFPRAEAQVYVQVIGDLAVITGLVYVTGGAGSRAGFMLLYPLSVLSGSVLLYRGKGLVLAGLATLFYAGILGAVREGWLPPQGLSEALYMPVKHLFYSVFVTGVACATVAMTGSYLSGSLKNVGDRLVEAREQVEDLRELNELIVESIQSGLLTADFAGTVLYINNVGASILGCPPEQIRGRSLRAVFGSRLVDNPGLGFAGDRQRMSRLELPVERADGSVVSLGVSVSRLATKDPGKQGHLVVFQDLTEIKRLEEDVRTNEKLAAVGEMAAHLAHEIRNPLGSISGSAQVLMKEPNISDEQEQLLGIITRESMRLSDTLNGFLVQARPALPRPHPFDLGQVIGEAVVLLRNGLETSSRHDISFEADRGPHVCLGDADRITQVFWNLARNGLEAMPRGGALAVKLRSEGTELVLTVRDEGLGIPKEEQQRIFEPFRSNSPAGVGLGLAIVYQIVKEHHGDISVRSSPAQGTEVEVRLPQVPVATSA